VTTYKSWHAWDR